MKTSISALFGTALFAASIGAMPAASAAAAQDAAASQTRHLETDGGTIAYDDTGGTGPLLVALPGMGDQRGQYRHLRPYLVKAGYRVVTMDVRGQGESSVEWDDYSAHAAARDVLALLEKLGAPSAVVIGNSFAAGAATWAAQLAPEKVRGTVLIGPIIRDLPVSPLVSLVLKAGFAGPWRNWFWMTYWNSLFPARKPADHEQYRERLRGNLREAGRFDALKTMVHLSKADTEAILERNRVPTLLVMGTKDADFADAAEEARLLASRMGAEQLLVEGAGHYPHAEMPELVGPRIVEFLGRLK